MQSSTHQIADEIQRYCISHPEARDTIEGITWWVHMQRQADLASGVLDAVQLLVSQGVLEKHRLQDGTEVFGYGRSSRTASTSGPTE